MNYAKRVLVAIDQLVAVVFFGCYPGETVSALAHRQQWRRTERFLNWLFCNELHCAMAYLAEMRSHDEKNEHLPG